MNTRQILEGRFPAERLLFGADMARYTTFRVGGPAEALLFPASEEEILSALTLCRDHDIPVFVMGKGSNLLIRDGGMDGLVIRLDDSFSGITAEGDTLHALAGSSLAQLSGAALAAGLTGLEFASGIPGSVGGGMAMNAGAYGGELSQFTVGCRVLHPKTLCVSYLDKDALEMGYRTTRALREGYIILSADLRLTPGDKAGIKALMDDLGRRRREKQPLTYPSAGSTFKRPEGHFAGALIEGAGLKGMAVGGACVSEKHAGFIVNTGSATAKDILDLIALVQKRVLEKDGVLLEPEVRILGKDPA